MNRETMLKWAQRTKEKLEKKMLFAARQAECVPFIPYSTENGKWKEIEIDWWTNGFWGATMWQMQQMTGNPAFREAAVRGEEMMDDALKNFETLHHDVGFMWLIQSGVRYALEKNEDSRKRTLLCANLLAGRFNPNGFIRAWNGDAIGWAIIDCMMNLPLLYWASRETGDPRYRLIAMRHADTTIKHFVRPDGSCNHIVMFDPETGEFIHNPGGQGYESGSSWTRGQAWALYGFALSYRMTGKKEYLDTAVKVADYFIASSQNNWLTPCDFRAPAEPVILDNAAGAIAACGLMEIADHLGAARQQPYFDAACNLLQAMDEHCADWTENTPA
ncbi:MAG: glycoside hydrolase family 88 protein, partial [Clostridia bacterium]|nr:glycoside hydrolase family 88 protein [Clostridia bacterium]